MITIGRLVGLQDQIALKRKSTNTVYIHLTVWLMTGVIGMLCVVVDLRLVLPLVFVGMVAFGLDLQISNEEQERDDDIC